MICSVRILFESVIPEDVILRNSEFKILITALCLEFNRIDLMKNIKHKNSLPEKRPIIQIIYSNGNFSCIYFIVT